MKTRILNPEELSQFCNDDSPASLLKGLYQQQRQSWPLLEKGYKNLSQIKTKTLEWYGDAVIVQFNPSRIVSVSANVDPNVIRNRTCFLCLENLPLEQTGILIQNEYLALANPFPVFNSHFTLAHIRHKRQDIVGHIEALLKVSRTLKDQFTVFFNGATAGASAPDHFHFQAIPRGSLPITEFCIDREDKIATVGTILSVEIETVSFFGSRYVVLRGPALEDLVSVLERMIYLLDSNHPCGKDMLNIIVDYTGDEWQVVFVPREKHRPDCFYEEEPQTLLVSPGAIEMSGVMILPREKDFDLITAEDIRSIYDEVILNATTHNRILSSLFKT
ncbi:MAG: DUF4922 domain-containing protein [bacterium]|nr:DUF4922 domain-containing protein [bacterium]